MTCREVNRFIVDYLDHALSPARRSAFERHLSICPDCRVFLETYAATIEVTRAALADDLPVPPVPESLVRAVLMAVSSPG